jgi:hypothetical protein
MADKSKGIRHQKKLLKLKNKSKSRRNKKYISKKAKKQIYKMKGCSRKKRNLKGLKGGMFPMSYWGPKVSEWPGVDGNPNNVYPLNSYDNQADRQLKSDGYNGGGLLGSLGSQINYNYQSGFNYLSGKPQPVNSMPYVQPELLKSN